MDCKEVQKNIAAFLDEELDGRSAERFLNHVEQCSECREELSIQYLVKEGMVRLEEGGSFDLGKDLKNLIADSYKKIRNQRIANTCIYIMEFIAFLAVIFILVLVFLNK